MLVTLSGTVTLVMVPERPMNAKPLMLVTGFPSYTDGITISASSQYSTDLK